MDVGLQQIVQGRVDQPVAGQRCHTAEGLRDDVHPEMAAAVLRTRMAGVTVALILDVEFQRREGFGEALAQQRHPAVRCHELPAPSAGSLSLEDSQITCGSMKAKSATETP